MAKMWAVEYGILSNEEAEEMYQEVLEYKAKQKGVAYIKPSKSPSKPSSSSASSSKSKYSSSSSSHTKKKARTSNIISDGVVDAGLSVGGSETMTGMAM
jgi:hypothetical protein